MSSLEVQAATVCQRMSLQWVYDGQADINSTEAFTLMFNIIWSRDWGTLRTDIPRSTATGKHNIQIPTI